MTINLTRLDNYADEACANNITEVKAKLTDFCKWLTTGTPLTYLQEFEHSNATDVAVRVGLGNGEVCFATSINRNLHANNYWPTTAYGTDDFMVSYTPAGSFGTLTDANNPWDDSTFCSDADAWDFRLLSLDDGSTSYYNDSCFWLGSYDNDSGTLVLINCIEITGGPYFQMLVCSEEFFEDGQLAIANDTDYTGFMVLPVYELTSTQTVNDFSIGEQYSELGLAFRCQGTAADDGFYEDGDLNGNVASFDFTTADFTNRQEDMRKVDVTSASVGGGQKGTINPDLFAICRADAGTAFYPGGTHCHLRRGLCIGVDQDAEQLA